MNNKTRVPAYPEPVADFAQHRGMSLRDHFAGEALPALIHGYSRNQGSGPYLDASPDEIAYWSYRYADAMLCEREKER